jgi:MFS family permease
LSPEVARRASRGLDWLNLFVANIQTGFGPFIAVYLTTQGWTQTQIGVALSLGTVASMASQLPAGALVDAWRAKRQVAGLSLVAFGLSALFFAADPRPLMVYLAEILHGFSSCTLGPAVAAMSLAVAGQAAFGLRLGRNARFASIGNGIGAALMGAAGYYLSERAVFYLTAILMLPALATLIPLAGVDDRPRAPSRPPPPRMKRHPLAGLGPVLMDRRLLIFAGCAMLFTFANAAMLPLAGTRLTRFGGNQASLLIAACIVLPQLVVAMLSPTVGRLAQSKGRRWVLLLGFASLPARGLLLALFAHPASVVLIQVLDGVSAACFGVMVPLVTSDISARTGHFNASLGLVGFAVGLGATGSTAVAGWIADRLGDPAAFASLSGAGVAAMLLVAFALPETRPVAIEEEEDEEEEE